MQRKMNGFAKMIADVKEALRPLAGNHGIAIEPPAPLSPSSCNL